MAHSLELPVWTVLPFVGLLLSIAILPLATPHFWESNRSKGVVAALFAVPVALYLLAAHGASGLHELAEKGKEYVSFIVLLASLFVVTGGIFVRGSLSGTPLVNTGVLGLGAVLASWIGTTGASVLLIRPMLRANATRERKAHIVVFFIFTVSNCGGLLTPLGDPPLFLGFLKGVPFGWTLGLWREWLLVNGALLVIFNVWDQRVLAAEERARPGSQLAQVMRHLPLGIEGRRNFAFLAALVAVIFAAGQGFGNAGEPWPFGVQEGLLVAITGLAFVTTPHRIRAANSFGFGPIVEVAVLFAGIFVTMAPALLLLNANAQQFGLEHIERGTAYEYGRLFEQELNKKLAAEKKLKDKNLKVRVVFIPVRRDQLLPGLAAGKGDVAAASLTITPERRKLVDFTAAGMNNVSEVLVSGPTSPQVASVDDLSGKEVFVRKSSSYHESLVALNEKFAAEKKPPVAIKDAPETFEDEDLLEILNAGIIPLTIVNKHVADFWKQIFPTLTVHDNVTVRTGAEIAWAIRKDSPLLKAEVDAVAARHKLGTSTGNQVLARYLKSVKYVKNSATEEERKKFFTLLGYFKKYGGQYDFDWLMIAAQAYQESQDQPEARSPAGAVGVMQVLPSTAADPSVNIRNISKIENNIHAGIKYMRFIRDNYLADAPMTRDRSAICSPSRRYNAGPNRIATMRKGRRPTGLDPNVWFQNVEYRGREGDRPGDRSVREQHLQVLRRLQARAGEQGCQAGRGRETQGRLKRDKWLCPLEAQLIKKGQVDFPRCERERLGESPTRGFSAWAGSLIKVY